MFRSLRENGPALLVPAAWTVAGGAVVGVVSTHALFVAHVVMSVLLVAFAVASRREMATGLLAVWLRVVLVGAPITLAGVSGFLLESDPLLAVALYGWAVLPAVGFVYTARRVTAGRGVYAVGAGCCVVGVAGLALSSSTTGAVLAIGLVGIGQTAGILDATLRY